MGTIALPQRQPAMHRGVAEGKIIAGGPRTRRGWGGNTDCNINTDACFDACVSQGSSRMVRNRPVLVRVIRRADTVAAFTHNASLYGNERSVLHCVARVVAKMTFNYI